MLVTGANSVITNSGTIAGGKGGYSLNAMVMGANGPSGAGVVLQSDGNTLTNEVGGAIQGAVVQPYNFMSPPADNGGVGVLVSGTGNTISNAGTIQGGSNGAMSMAAGVPAIDVTGNNNKIINSGVLSSMGVDALSVLISGTGNTLEIHDGSIIYGVQSTGSGNTLALGGTADSSFDVGTIQDSLTIGIPPGYIGFDAFEKVGASTWSLSGLSQTAGATEWAVKAGTLKLINPVSSGSTSFLANVAVDGGTLLLERNVMQGSGTTELVGNVTVNSGALAQILSAKITGTLNVMSGGRFKTYAPAYGGAEVTGAVTVADGGKLAFLVDNTTMGATFGSLVLSNASVLELEVQPGGPIPTAGLTVNNLTLNGVLDVTGTLGAGSYLLIDYATLTADNELTLGTVPGGFTYAIVVDTSGTQVLLNVTAAATGLYWNGASTSGGPDGGTGTWNTTSLNWTDAAGTTPAAWDGTLAIFSVAQATNDVTVVGPAPGDISVTGIQFDVDGYVISGDSITLDAPSGQTGIAVASGAGATIGSVLRGTTGLEKTDAGTLVLTGANTYTGGTTVTAGTLQIGNGGTTGEIQGDVVDDAALVFNRSNGTTFSGAISGGGTLEQKGVGTLILSGTNTYTGGTTITAGTLQIGAGGTTGSIQGNVVNNAALVFNHSDGLTFGGNISGSGTLEQKGTGALLLSGANSYDGATIVSAGTLRITNNTALGSTAGGTTVASGATLRLEGATVGAEALTLSGTGFGGSGALASPIGTNSFAGAITLAADSLITSDILGILTLSGGITGPGRNLTLGGTGIFPSTVSGVIGTGAGTLTKTGMGTWTLSGANTYVGVTTVSAGTLVISNDGALGATTAGTTVASGAVLALNEAVKDAGVTVGAEALTLSGTGAGANGALANMTGTNSFAGAITLATDSLITSPASQLTLSGGIGGAGKNLELRGYGTVSGAIATGTGGVTIGSGSSWVFTTANSYTGTTSIVAGSALQLGNYMASGSVAGNIALEGSVNFYEYAAQTYSKVISGSGSLMKSGETLTLTGENTYSGGTSIYGGTLQIGDGGTAGSIIGNVVNYGNLVFNRSNDMTFTGSISDLAPGSGTVEKLGAGTLKMTGLSSFTGATTVTAGTLEFTDTAGYAGTITVKSGATLKGDTTGIRPPVFLNSDVTVENGGRIFAGASQMGGLGLGVNDLILSDTSHVAVLLGAPGWYEAFHAATLTLDGVLDVTNTGSLASGTYLVMTYGALTADNGLTLGALPSGSLYALDTATSGEVSLIVAAGQWWNGSTTSAGGSVVGGTGTWDVAAAPTNWTDAAGSAAGAWSQSSLAIFAGAAGTVTVSGATAPEVAGLEFLVSGYVLQGGSITLTPFASNTSVRVAVGDGTPASSAFTATIASELTGSTGLEKTEAGKLILTGANTYTGGTTLTGGTLQIGNGGTTGAVAGNIVDNAALVFNRSDTVAYSGVVSGAGTLEQKGAGTLVLTGSNTYSGGTSVSAGTLQIGNGATSGSIAGAIANSGTVAFNRSDDILAPGAVTGSGALVQRGTGALQLVGANSAAAGTRVEAGTLRLMNGVTLASDIVVRSGATLQGETSGTSGAVVHGNVSIADGGTLLAAPTAGAGTFGLSMTALTLSDAANLSVKLGSNTGNAVFSAGTLALDGVLNVESVGPMALGVYRILNYTTLASDHGLRLGATPTDFAYGIQQLPGQVNLEVVSGDILYWNGTRITSDGTVHGGNGTWTDGPATNWTTTPANQSKAWNGTFAVFAGTPGTVTIDGAGVSATGLQFMVDGYLVTGGTLTLAAAGRTPIRVGDGTPAGAAYVATIASVIDGTRGLEKTDLGTLILTGANIYTGGTRITQGTLQIGNGGTSGAILGDVLNNGVLAFNRSDDTTYSGVVSGTGALAKAGAGTLTLTGANTYGGGTTVSGGTVRVYGAGALGTGGLALQGRGALRASESFSYAGAVLLTPVAGSGGGTFAVDPEKTLTLAGAIGGSGALDKQGAGTLLIGTNTYSGATNVGAGTLNIAGGSSLSDTARLRVAAGAALNLTDADETVGSLAGGGAVGLNGHCLTTGGDGTSSTFSGSITGSGCLAKTGAGTLTLTGDSDYDGGTTVSGGTVRVSGAGALGTGPLALQGPGTLRASNTFTDARAISLTPVDGAGGGTFEVDDTKTLTLAGAIAGLGNLAKTGTGTLIIGGANSYKGATNVNAGTLIATGGQAIGDTSAVNVAAKATFILRGNETVGSIAGAGALVLDGARLTTGGDNASTTYAGAIGGPGGLTKSGTGRLTLTGASTYAGDTLVTGGGLAVEGRLAGDVYVHDLATLSGGGTIARTVHVLDGGTLEGTQARGLTMGGLDLSPAANVNVTLGAPSTSPVFRVKGDVTLDGTLNVSAAPGFGLGIYRIMSYSGALTDNGMQVGPLAGGLAGGVQSSIAGQVNLFVEDPNSPILFWNGAHTAPTSGVLGGTGSWTAAAQTNWINASGTISKAWNSGFAVFQATPGTVTVDNSHGQVSAVGMQFVDTGYVVTGGDILLTGTTPAPIRVGDGTAAGAATVATIASALTGTAGIEKSDFGTLVLSGANTYTGGTLVSAGTLQIGAGGATGSVAGDVVNNATLAFDLSGESTFSGAISGTGALVQAGTGTLTLTGANTYSGGTRIDAGTLQIFGADALGTGGLTLGTAGGLRASGTFTYGGAIALAQAGDGPGARIEVDDAKALTVSGVISGAGGLTKAGAGTLILTGANTYKGLTTVSAGTLQIGNGGTAGSIAGDVVNNASLVFNRSDTYAFTGAITGAGAVTFTGGGTVLFSSPYTGPVAVNESVVKLEAGSSTASPFTVNSGGVLGGTARIGGLTVNGGGIAAPGYSPGTLTVDGAVAFNSGSVYQVDVTPDGAHDLIIASGAVTLSSGATVEVKAEPGRYDPTSSVTILTTSGAVSGTFGGVTSDYAFLDPVLAYDAQNVYLQMTYSGIDFATYARTPNEAGVAVAAQALGAGNAVYDALLSLPVGAVAPAFNALSGEIYASADTVLLQESIYVREAVGARLRQAAAGPGALAQAAAAAGPSTAQLSRDLGVTLWAQGYGGWGNSFGNGNAASISNSLGGFLIGADVAVAPNAWAGVFGGFSQSSFDVDARSSSGSSDNYEFGAYAGAQFGAFALRGGFAYGWHDVSVSRSIAFPGFSRTASAGYATGTTQLFGEVGYDVTAGTFAFEPFAGLAYVNSGGAAFTEGFGAAALAVDTASMDTLYSTLGVRVATAFDLLGRALTPSVTLGWQHAFGDTTPSAAMRFLGGMTPFAVSGVPVAEDALLLNAGLAYGLSDATALAVTYTGQFAPSASQNAFTAQLSVKF
ncbi:autotransporter-associated beta strand repeat-containing protein [Xanthobacter sediminis]